MLRGQPLPCGRGDGRFDEGSQFIAFPSGDGYHQFVAEAEKLRELPAVHEVLSRLDALLARFPRALVADEVRRILEARRAGIRAGSSAESEFDRGRGRAGARRA